MVSTMPLEVRCEIPMETPAVAPQMPPRCPLEELLAQCVPAVKRCKKEREWLASEPAGRELF